MDPEKIVNYTLSIVGIVLATISLRDGRSAARDGRSTAREVHDLHGDMKTLVRALTSSPDLDVQVDSRGMVTAVGVKHATAASQITAGPTMRVTGTRGPAQETDSPPGEVVAPET